MTYPATYGDTGAGPVLVVAARWIEGLVSGPLATAVAVIGIALVGLLMLQGSVDWRRGMTVCLGCFVVFGAPTMIASFRSGIYGVGTEAVPDEVPVAAVPAQPMPPVNYDPYAGAALPPQ